METIVKLYSTHKNEINRFLNSFFANNNYDHSVLEWKKKINLKLICGLA